MTMKLDFDPTKPATGEAPSPAPAAPKLDFDPTRDTAAPTPAPPKSGLVRRAVGDTLVDVGAGAMGLGESLVGLLDIPTAGYAGKGLEAIGYNPKQVHKELDAAYSPERQAANQAVNDAHGFVPTAKAYLQNPSTVVGGVVQALPMLLGSGKITKALGAVEGLAGKEALRVAAGEGILGAGSAAEQTRQSTDDGTLSAGQVGAAIGSGVGTGAFNLLGGKVAHKLGIEDPDALAAGLHTGNAAALAPGKLALLKRLAGGAFSEGVLEEMPQSTQEQMWQNVATGRPLMEGVPEAAAAGGIVGAAMGAPFAAIPPPKAAPTDPPNPATGTADPAATAADPTDPASQGPAAAAPSGPVAAAPSAPTGSLARAAEDVATQAPPADAAPPIDLFDPSQLAGPFPGAAPGSLSAAANELTAKGAALAPGATPDTAADPGEAGVAPDSMAHLAARAQTPSGDVEADRMAQLLAAPAAHPRALGEVAAWAEANGRPDMADAAYNRVLDRLTKARAKAGANPDEKAAAVQAEAEADMAAFMQAWATGAETSAPAPASAPASAAPDTAPAPAAPAAPAAAPAPDAGGTHAPSAADAPAPTAADPAAAPASTPSPVSAAGDSSAAGAVAAAPAAAPASASPAPAPGAASPSAPSSSAAPPSAATAAPAAPQGSETRQNAAGGASQVPGTASPAASAPVGDGRVEAAAAKEHPQARDLLRQLGQLTAERLGRAYQGAADISTQDGTFAGLGTLNMDDDGNVILQRSATDEDHLGKGWAASAGPEDLQSTSITHGGGGGLPTTALAGHTGGWYGDSPDRVVGEFRIPAAELLELVRNGDAMIGNLGEGEIVLNPAAAKRYLHSINGQRVGAPTGKVDAAATDAALHQLTEQMNSNRAAMRQQANATREQFGLPPIDYDAKDAATERAAIESERDHLRASLANGVHPVTGEKLRGNAIKRAIEAEAARLDAQLAGETPSRVDAAAAEAAQSSANDHPAPTEGQIEAGNYKKGHVRLHGLDIAIETPAGEKRRPEWPPLAHHYGYVKGSIGRDKDHVDVFLTEHAEDASRPVFVVDQVDPKTGKFDEHKVIIGAATADEARAAYAANYAPDWQGLGGLRKMTQAEFRAWVKDPAKTTKPASGKIERAEGSSAAPGADRESLAEGEGLTLARELTDETRYSAHAVAMAREDVKQLTAELKRLGWTHDPGKGSQPPMWFAPRPSGGYLFTRSQGPDSSVIVQWSLYGKPEITTITADSRLGDSGTEWAIWPPGPVGRYQALPAQYLMDKNRPGGFMERAELLAAGVPESVLDTLDGRGAPRAAPKTKKAPKKKAQADAPAKGDPKAAAERLLRLFDAFDAPRNTLAGSGRVDIRHAAEMLQKGKVDDALPILDRAQQRLFRQFPAQADVITEVYESLQPPTAGDTAAADAPAEPTSDELEEFQNIDHEGRNVLGTRDAFNAEYALRDKAEDAHEMPYAAFHPDARKGTSDMAPSVRVVQRPDGTWAYYAFAGQKTDLPGRATGGETYRFGGQYTAIGKFATRAEAVAAGLTRVASDARSAKGGKAAREVAARVAAWADGLLAREQAPAQEQRAPAGPRVIVNRIGADGLTDAERAAGKPSLADPAPTIEVTEAQGRVPMGFVADVQKATGFKASTMTAAGGIARFREDAKLGDWTFTSTRFGEQRAYTVKVDERGTATVTETHYKKGAYSTEVERETTRTIDAGITPDNWVEATTALLTSVAPAKPNGVSDPWPGDAKATPAKPAPSANTVFTEDAAEKARAVLRAKLGQLNTGIDPEILQAGLTLAGYHIEKGARTFAAYVQAMVADLGEGIRPYLKSWYMGVKYDPRAAAFEGMDSAADVEAFDVTRTTAAGVDSAPTTAPEASNERAGQSDDVPAAGPRDAADDAPAGANDREPLDAGLAEAGEGAAGSGDLFAGPAQAGGSRAGGAGRAGDESPGAARADAGGRAEPGAAGSVSEDFDLTGEDIGAGGLTAKYRDNLAAIKIIKALDAEGRPSTAAERKALARYVGWGALKGVFDPANKQWARQHAELKALLTDAEWKAALASTRNAHFTSKDVAGAMVAGLQRLGFTRGRLLEPSVGVGNFFGLLPAELRKASQLYGVELDPITAKIAQGLYPSAKVANMGFEAYGVPGGFFDAAIGNPPFGEEPLVDLERTPYSGFSIHNYFFAKTLDKLRDGGLMLMVVSHNLLDAKDSRARDYLAKRARLVDAVRLPRTAFKGNAGTEVVTDILVLQKTAGGEPGAAWTKAGTQANVSPKTGETVEHSVNRFFLDQPGKVLGTPSAAGSMYRADEYTVEPNGDLAEQLKAWAEQLPAGIHQPIDRTATMVNASVPDGVRIGGYYVEGDKILRRGDDEAGEKTASEWTPPNAKAAERMRAMIGVRELLRDQMRLELSREASDTAIEANRAKLAQAYADFVKRYDHINNPTNRRLFVDDADADLLQSLEFNYDRGVSKAVAAKEGIEPREASATPADILTRRVMHPADEMARVDGAEDGLTASLNYRGIIDLPYMAAITGTAPDALRADLLALKNADGSPVVFETPDGTLEPADAYLSGDVKTKLAEAREAARGNKALARNVDALEKVQPADKKPSEIHVSIGAPFVPGDMLAEFMGHITGGRYAAGFVRATGQWATHTSAQPDRVRNTQTWGTERMTAEAILAATLQGKAVVVVDRFERADGSSYTVVNEPATEAARAKQDAIKQEWKSWLWGDGARADALLQVYNDTMNRIVPRRYDGSHLTLPGKSPAITLRQHQLAGVWRGLQSRQMLLDQVVGAGKTYEMVAIAMEMRRLGIARKPVFAVPNHLTLQWKSEFAALYPGARVLAATPGDFSKDMRPKLFAKIATGDWDAVILGHSQLKKIGLPAETEAAIIQEQVNDLAAAIALMKRERGDRNIIRDMEGIKKRLEAKAKDKLASVGKRDKVLTFDELGLDALFVDELHEFKNLTYSSTMTRVPGMGNPAGSAKSFDLFLKTQWLFNTFGDKAPLITATGTPVSNSLVEMFNMQRFMQYPTLKAKGLQTFDAWARAYGSVENVYEVAPSGSGFRASSRFAKFQNLGSLMNDYLTFADVVTLDDLKAQSAAKGERFPVPKMRGGKPKLTVAPRSPLVENFMGMPRLAKDEAGRAQFKFDPARGDTGSVEPSKDGTQFTATVKPAGAAHGTSLGQYETEADARMALVEAGLTPAVTLDPNSILGQFANLRELTRETKGKVNALSLTGAANKAGLDYRLIDPHAPDFADSKINKAVGEIVRIHGQWTADKGTQLVFLDTSVPLSARAAAASKAKRAYVRLDGQLTHAKATLHTVDGAEEIPYFVAEHSRGEFTVHDAATGHPMHAALPSRAEAKKWATEALADETARQAWLDTRAASAELDQAEIDDYNDATFGDSDDEEAAVFTLQDILGVAAKFSVYDDMKAKLIAAGIPEREIAFIHDYDSPTAKAKLFAAVNRGDVRVLFGSTPKMGAGTNVQERAVALHHIDAPWRPSDLEQREGRIIRQKNALYARDPDGFEVEIHRYATERTYDARRWQILEHKARGIEQLRNFDGTLNEIEDIDGEAANAADMKAAASGDPLILRETQLRNDVKRLENLEAGHANEQAAARHTARNEQFHLTNTHPKRLARLEAMAAAATARAAEGELPAGTVVDKTASFADRKAFGQVLTRAFAEVRKASDGGYDDVSRTIRWRGIAFDLSANGRGGVTLDTEAHTGLWSKGPDDEFSAVGLTTVLDRYVDSLPGRVEEAKAAIATAERTVRESLASAERPFPQADDLKAARAEYRAVQRKLLLKGPDLPAKDKATLTQALPGQREALRAAGFGDALDELLGNREAEAGLESVEDAAALARALGDDGVPLEFDAGAWMAEAEAKAALKRGRETAARMGLDTAAARLLAGIPNAPAVEFMHGHAALPARLRDGLQKRATERGGDSKLRTAALYDATTGRVFLFTDVARDVDSALFNIAHEIAGHHGLRSLLGAKLGAVLDTAAANPTVRALADAIQRERKSANDRLMVEEALAELAAAARTGDFAKLEKRYRVPMPADVQKASRGFIADLVDRLRRLIAKVMGRDVFTNRQVRELLEAAYRAADRQGPPPKGGNRTLRTQAGLEATTDTADEAGGLESVAGPADVAPAKETAKAWLARQGKGRLTDLKPAALALVPLNHLADWAGKTRGAVRTYLEQQYAMQAMRNGLYRQYDAIAQRWLAYASAGTGLLGALGRKTNDAGRALADLMHSATLAGVDPTSERSDYKRSPAKLEAWDRLRAQYDALGAEGQQLFTDVRDAYSAHLKALEDTLAKNLRRSMEYGVAKAERRHAARLAKIEEDAELSDAERQAAIEAADADLKKATAYSAQAIDGKIAALRQKFEGQRVAGPYFPLARFGKYWATVLDADGHVVSFSKFESAVDQQAFAKAMQAEGHTVRLKYEGDKTDLAGMVDPAFVAEVEGLLTQAEAPDGLKDAVWQAYLERMPDLSMRKAFLHRKKTAGFSADALRAFGSRMFHGSYQLARLEYGVQMANTLDVAEEKARGSVDDEQLVEELRKRHQWVMNPQGSVGAQVATTLAFTYYLGANPAHLLLNATQTLMLGLPILGSKVGFARAGAALFRAANDFRKGRGHIEKADLTDDERAAMQAFMDSGLIDKSQAHDLAGVGENGVEYSAVRTKVMNKLGWFFHQSERFNREVTALTAYRLARGDGLGHAAAIRQATQQTYAVHFDYSSAARPRAMQGDLAKLLLVFRNYNVNMLYRLFRDAHQAFRGESPQVRREARRQLGAIFGMYGLMAGTMGVPLYGLAIAMAGAFEDDDDPLTAEQQFILGMRELLGEDAARILLRGVPGALAGVDLTDRIGMPNLWFRSPDRELEGQDAYYFWLEQLLGATPSVAKNVFDGLNLVHQGHVGRGVERLLPAALRNLVRAARYADEGATTLNGDAIGELTGADALRQALGYTPLDLSEQYEANDLLKGGDTRLARRRQRLIDRLFLAQQAGDDGDREEALTEIRAFTLANPAYAISGDTLRRSGQLRARHRAMNRDGIVLNRRILALEQQIEAGDGEE